MSNTSNLFLLNHDQVETLRQMRRLQKRGTAGDKVAAERLANLEREADEILASFPSDGVYDRIAVRLVDHRGIEIVSAEAA